MNSENAIDTEEVGQNLSALNFKEEDIILHRSDNAYKPLFKICLNLDMHPDEYCKPLSRFIRCVLNMVTPENYVVLLEDHLKIFLWTVDCIPIIARMLFERAICEPKYCHLYAKLSVDLSTVDAKTMYPENALSFKRYLLKLCHEEFGNAKYNELIRDVGHNNDDEKSQEVLTKAKHRILGKIRFIGELHKLKMIPIENTCEYLNKLINDGDELGDELSLECLCLLLTTAGKELETSMASSNETGDSENVDSCMIMLAKVVEEKKLSPRLRFIILDLIELRSNRWIPRRRVDVPMMLNEIREEAKIEMCSA